MTKILIIVFLCGFFFFFFFCVTAAARVYGEQWGSLNNSQPTGSGRRDILYRDESRPTHTQESRNAPCVKVKVNATASEATRRRRIDCSAISQRRAQVPPKIAPATGNHCGSPVDFVSDVFIPRAVFRSERPVGGTVQSDNSRRRSRL